MAPPLQQFRVVFGWNDRVRLVPNMSDQKRFRLGTNESFRDRDPLSSAGDEPLNL